MSVQTSSAQERSFYADVGGRASKILGQTCGALIGGFAEVFYPSPSLGSSEETKWSDERTQRIVQKGLILGGASFGRVANQLAGFNRPIFSSILGLGLGYLVDRKVSLKVAKVVSPLLEGALGRGQNKVKAIYNRAGEMSFWLGNHAEQVGASIFGFGSYTSGAIAEAISKRLSLQSSTYIKANQIAQITLPLLATYLFETFVFSRLGLTGILLAAGLMEGCEKAFHQIGAKLSKTSNEKDFNPSSKKVMVLGRAISALIGFQVLSSPLTTGLVGKSFRVIKAFGQLGFSQINGANLRRVQQGGFALFNGAKHLVENYQMVSLIALPYLVYFTLALGVYVLNWWRSEAEKEVKKEKEFAEKTQITKGKPTAPIAAEI